MTTAVRAPSRPRPPAALSTVRVLERIDRPALRYRWAIDPWPGRVPGFPLYEARTGPGRFPTLEGRALSADVLARLARRDAAEVGAREPVVLGAAADPWPAEEERARRTRRILEALAALEGLDLAIVTRSDLVARDLDVLTRLAERHVLGVRVAIPTLDRRLGAALEPGAPRPDLRLKALSELAAAGVPVGLRIAPVLPDLSDGLGGLDAIAAAAAGAGASSLEAEALALPPSGMRAVFPVLAREFPDLVGHARERWEASSALPADYRAGLADLVERLRRKHGLDDRGDEPPSPGGRSGPQLGLF